MNKEKMKKLITEIYSDKNNVPTIIGFKVDENLLNYIDEFMQEKIRKVNEKFPQLIFDEHGRAVIKVLDDKVYRDMSKIEKVISSEEYEDSVYLSILTAMKNRNYSHIRDHSACYINLYLADGHIDNDGRIRHLKRFLGSFIDYNHVVSKAHFLKNVNGQDKKVNIKFTKILSEAKEIWAEENNYLKDIIQQLKEENKKENKDMNKIFELRDLKKKEEEKHMFTRLDRALSETAVSENEKIILSINPMDRLFMSGSSKDSLTTFTSCMGLNVYPSEDGIVFSRTSMGGPRDLLKFGLLSNICMIYNINGRELEVLGRKYLGMKSRTVAWFEDLKDRVFIETVYPTRSEEAAEEYSNALASIGINSVIKAQKDDDVCSTYTLADEYVMDTIDIDDELFLDRVYVSEDKTIKKLDTLRSDCEYDNNIFDPYHVNNTLWCNDCEEWIDRSEFVRIYTGDDYDDYFERCYSCAEEIATGCFCCGEYVINEDVREYYKYGVSHSVYVCDYCVDSYHKCNECNFLLEKYEAESINGHFYCEECAEKIKEKIEV